jgi:hypothetical protein
MSWMNDAPRSTAGDHGVDESWMAARERGALISAVKAILVRGPRTPRANT